MTCPDPLYLELVKRRRGVGHHDDFVCLTNLSEECLFLAAKLREKKPLDNPDIDDELTDVSVCLAKIYNKIEGK